MTEQQIIKKLEDLQKQINSLLVELKGKKELGPIQQAVKDATNSKATSSEFVQALETLYKSPEQLSNKQVAFVLYFGMLNHKDLGEDIDYWLSLELGKRKYNQRTEAIEDIRRIIDQNYKGNDSFKQRLDEYLVAKEK